MTNRERFLEWYKQEIGIHEDAQRCRPFAWAAWQAACPEGWQAVPQKITAETGHKYALMGEFSEPLTLKCPECYDLGGTDEDCDICQGEGEYQHQVPVRWGTIKRIHGAIVAASPKPEE